MGTVVDSESFRHTVPVAKTKGEVMPIETALKYLETIRNIDSEMPLQQAHCLLLIAKAQDGCSLTELANKAGIGLATASRYVAALGKINRKKEEGGRNKE